MLTYSTEIPLPTEARQITGRTKDGIEFSVESRAHFAFNSFTTPRRLILKQQSQYWAGTIVVHSPGFIPDDEPAKTVNLKLVNTDPAVLSQIASEIAIPAFADCSHVKGGSYLLRVRIDSGLVQPDGVLSSLELRHGDFDWFRVPVSLEK
jgi:hypothetical protein